MNVQELEMVLALERAMEQDGAHNCVVTVRKWGQTFVANADIAGFVDAVKNGGDLKAAIWDDGFNDSYRAVLMNAYEHFDGKIPDGLERLSVTMDDVQAVRLRQGKQLYRNPKAGADSRAPEWYPPHAAPDPVMPEVDADDVVRLLKDKPLQAHAPISENHDIKRKARRIRSGR